MRRAYVAFIVWPLYFLRARVYTEKIQVTAGIFHGLPFESVIQPVCILHARLLSCEIAPADIFLNHKIFSHIEPGNHC